MSVLGSDNKQAKAAHDHGPIPISGEKLALAVEAMKTPNFLMRLTARIMKLAKTKGFHSPFKDSMDLPGGKSAADLASDIVEKAMDGSFNWNREEIPDFYHFCLSRAESILSNWLDRAKWSRSMSPIAAEKPESGEVDGNPLTWAIEPDDIYSTLRTKDSGALGDRFLEDFAFSLADDSPEQSIMMAVFDDRECGDRAYCCMKLKMSGESYDAAKKRLLRRLPAFVHEWRAKNKVGDADWKEAR